MQLCACAGLGPSSMTAGVVLTLVLRGELCRDGAVGPGTLSLPWRQLWLSPLHCPGSLATVVFPHIPVGVCAGGSHRWTGLHMHTRHARDQDVSRAF